MTQRIAPGGGHRIACVQNGDYAAALAAMRSNGAEAYGGQFASVEAFERLVAGGKSLVLALGTKPGRLTRSEGAIITFARGVGPSLLPGRWREWLLARRMIRELRAFKPTHLLLRMTDVIGATVLAWAVRQKVPTIGIIASTLEPWRSVDRRFCALANSPNVSFVGNHLRVATESLCACGLRPEKAVEYDVPGRLSPEVFPAKSLEDLGSALPSVVFVSTLSEDKGAGDVLEARRLLRARGVGLRLTVCGDGPLADAFQLEHVAGQLSYLGHVPREQVVELMTAATLVVVPSRPAFAEGLPLTLLEALAVRTPVVLSTHPVFRKYFTEGVGATFFDAGNPAALAEAIARVLSSPELYAALSRTTAEAWRGAQTSTTLVDLFDRARHEWQLGT